jgi:hypothetical protein
MAWIAVDVYCPKVIRHYQIETPYSLGLVWSLDCTIYCWVPLLVYSYKWEEEPEWLTVLWDEELKIDYL